MSQDEMPSLDDFKAHLGKLDKSNRMSDEQEQ